MSRFARLFPSAAAQPRRSYSIFSSRSGSGRYFNSAKPSKVITSTTKSGQSSSSGTNAKPEPIDKLAEDGQSPTQEQQIATDPSQSFATPATAMNDSFNSMASSSRPAVPTLETPPHLTLKPNDLNLHRFFALHRPCLLLNQPASALFEPVKANTNSIIPPSPLGTIDDPPVASPEADSDAARQLSRSLVMSRVGNTVDWEHALARLGLGEAKLLDMPTSSNVTMDSVKRKRRKKMKKHKYVFYCHNTLSC